MIANERNTLALTTNAIIKQRIKLSCNLITVTAKSEISFELTQCKVLRENKRKCRTIMYESVSMIDRMLQYCNRKRQFMLFVKISCNKIHNAY